LFIDTIEPDPVTEVVRADNTPVPKPVMFCTGRPVQFTRLPLDGVPSTGATNVGELNVLLLIVAPLIVAPFISTIDPDPVTEVPNAEATPVPSPDNPETEPPPPELTVPASFSIAVKIVSEEDTVPVVDANPVSGAAAPRSPN